MNAIRALSRNLGENRRLGAWVCPAPSRRTIPTVRGWLLRHRLRVIVHRIRFPGVPMFSEAAVHELLGKRVIVGITHETQDGHVVSRDQYDGRIVRANQSEGVVLQSPSGEELKLPPDLRAFFGARAGEYRFKSTGHVVADPDLQTAWTHTVRRQGDHDG
jgi:hypothetical protein